MKFSKDKEKAKEEYNKIIINSKKDFHNELLENDKNCEYEIIKIKEKFDKESKIITQKYKLLEQYNKNNLDTKITSLTENYKKEVYIKTISLNEQINHFLEIVKLNELVYNTYNKYKENYYFNKNIINLLINYYNKGNNILNDIKDNEIFMEAKNQRDENKNNKRNSFQLDIHGPKIDAGLELPGIDIHGPKIGVPSLDIPGPKINPGIGLPGVDIHGPRIGVPSIDLSRLDIHGPKIDVPSLDIHGPKIGNL